jgi:hypothetical protein
MKHAIGFRKDRIKGRKYKRYEAFRNHFSSAEGCDGFEELEKLAEQGLMISRQSGQYWFFHVTKEGFKYLSDVTNVSISEID